MKIKQTKAQRIAALERQLQEAHAQQVHTAHFASIGLERASTKRFAASAVIITVTGLGGEQLVVPTAIRGGLSDASIAALQADLVRSYNDALVFKPKGA